MGRNSLLEIKKMLKRCNAITTRVFKIVGTQLLGNFPFSKVQGRYKCRPSTMKQKPFIINQMFPSQIKGFSSILAELSHHLPT